MKRKRNCCSFFPFFDVVLVALVAGVCYLQETKTTTITDKTNSLTAPKQTTVYQRRRRRSEKGVLLGTVSYTNSDVPTIETRGTNGRIDHRWKPIEKDLSSDSLDLSKRVRKPLCAGDGVLCSRIHFVSLN